MFTFIFCTLTGDLLRWWPTSITYAHAFASVIASLPFNNSRRVSLSKQLTTEIKGSNENWLLQDKTVVGVYSYRFLLHVTYALFTEFFSNVLHYMWNFFLEYETGKITDLMNNNEKLITKLEIFTKLPPLNFSKSILSNATKSYIFKFKFP